MPPSPIIAPQPRRLLPQPTIIDPSVPVLPINLDDPFIVSVLFGLCLPYPIGLISLSYAQCHTPAPKNAQLPRLMSPICIHHRTKRSLVRLLLSNTWAFPFIYRRFLLIFLFGRPLSLRPLVAPSSDKWAAHHVPHAVDGTIFARKLSLHPV
jgi:hypothetical protein